MAGACVSPGTGGLARTPCGPPATCDNNSVVHYAYCAPDRLLGAVRGRGARGVSADVTCGGAGEVPDERGAAKQDVRDRDRLRPSAHCLCRHHGAADFSDPSCDDGECHWKQIVDTCGSELGTVFTCSAGTCFDPGMLTRRPITPTPTPDPMQPPAAPEHSCSVTADCPQPSRACFYDSLVTYVRGTCRAGACSWEINLSQCGYICSGRVPGTVSGRRLSRTELLHLVVAVAVCLVIPAFSYARGEGGFAWTMFSRSDSFRLSVTAVDPAGNVHLLHPVELADGVEPALRTYLRGQTAFEPGRWGRRLRRGCRSWPGSAVATAATRRSR